MPFQIEDKAEHLQFLAGFDEVGAMTARMDVEVEETEAEILQHQLYLQAPKQQNIAPSSSDPSKKIKSRSNRELAALLPDHKPVKKPQGQELLYSQLTAVLEDLRSDQVKFFSELEHVF